MLDIIFRINYRKRYQFMLLLCEQKLISSTKLSNLRIPFKVSQVLKRASSVPTRVPEVVQLMQKHEQTQSQQDSVEIAQTTAPTTLTPSTTEESVTNAGHSQMASGISSREPLLYNSSSSNQATGSSQTPEEEYRNNGQGLTTKLPGVIPLSGHNCPSGWL